jgi:hypothetical protein
MPRQHSTPPNSQRPAAAPALSLADLDAANGAARALAQRASILQEMAHSRYLPTAHPPLMVEARQAATWLQASGRSFRPGGP